MKHYKKYLLFLSFILLVVLYQVNKRAPISIKEEDVVKEEVIKKELKKVSKTDNKVSKKVKPLIFNKREISSVKNISNPDDLKVTNKFNPKWESITRKNILRNFKGQKVDLKIKHVKSLVYVKYNTGVLAEKVKVEIKLASGKVSRYNALVNSETGTIINTWNNEYEKFKKV